MDVPEAETQRNAEFYSRLSFSFYLKFWLFKMMPPMFFLMFSLDAKIRKNDQKER